MDAEEGFESMSFAVTSELIGASRKNFALMPQIFHKLRISSNSKKEKSPEALNFLGILVAEEGFEPTTFGL